MADERMESQAGTAKQGRRGRFLPLMIVVGLMIGEGVVIFVVTRALNREPLPAVAAQGAAGGQAGVADHTDLAEIELAECKPTNRVTGKLISFHLRVSALVPLAEEQPIEQLIKEKRERIRDRVNFVIRSAEPSHLAEPGLETIKRRIKHEIDVLLGDDRIIRDVLIPEFLQSNSGV